MALKTNTPEGLLPVTIAVGFCSVATPCEGPRAQTEAKGEQLVTGAPTLPTLTPGRANRTGRLQRGENCRGN